MIRQFDEFGFLYQEGAATYLFQFEDEKLAYFDKNSNLCIGKGVLALFNALTPDAVYERAGKFWRRRLETDQPGRLQ
ncbi:hypothetical protein [Bosea sp. Tri-54]|nr:hypothetical protein [Bosea sp. Tri-54]